MAEAHSPVRVAGLVHRLRSADPEVARAVIRHVVPLRKRRRRRAAQLLAARCWWVPTRRR